MGRVNRTHGMVELSMSEPFMSSHASGCFGLSRYVIFKISDVSQLFNMGPAAMYLDCGTGGQEVRLSLVQNTTVSPEAIRAAG